MEATAMVGWGSAGYRFSQYFLPSGKQILEFRDAEVRLSKGRSNGGCHPTPYRIQAMVGQPSIVKKDVSRRTFVKPEGLFPSEEGVSTSGQSAEKEVDGSKALFFLTVSTSQDDNSDISEPDVGILISVIGENGKAVLRTVPPIDGANPSRFQTRFQAGSKDSDVFMGTNLGRLTALWIAPEKGTWRLAQARVIVVQWMKDFDKIDESSRRDLNTVLLLMANILDKSRTPQKWKGYVHFFNSNEKLLGVGDDSLAAELKPSLVQEYTDPAVMRQAVVGSSSKSGGMPSSSYLPPEEIERLRALSMKDYETLKLQFLGISSLLVGLGTAAFAALGEDRLTESFAVGGLGGFLYLLLLQRFVDQLPGPAADSSGDSSTGGSLKDGAARGFVGGARLPLSIALVAGIALLVGRISQGGTVNTITPQMLVAGVGGFLTSRVAVIVASLRAKSSSPQDDDD